MRFASVVVVLLSLVASTFAADQTISVSAAISLKPVLLGMKEDFEKSSDAKVTFNFGASGALAGQIKAGAPVDVFISAAQKQVDDLDKAGLLDDATVGVVARNRLVLIVPAKAQAGPKSLDDLRDAKVGKVAIGQPKTVPAGDYASQVLAKKGLTEALADKLVLGTNVRQVLDYVIRGEVDAGLVYTTDAIDAGDAVRVVETVDASLHQPIVYPCVVVKGTAHPKEAAAFLEYMKGEKGQAVLAVHGFEPGRSAPTTVPAK
jgi:molybdate transport system substrate-binding protein